MGQVQPLDLGSPLELTQHSAHSMELPVGHDIGDVHTPGQSTRFQSALGSGGGD